MKKLSYLLSALVLVAMFTLVGCGGSDDESKTPEEIAGTNFNGIWTASAVTFDNEDRSAVYDDFSLNVTYTAPTNGGTYTASGGEVGASPWPGTGSWTFDGVPTETAFQVTRNDGLVISVSNLTETSMTLVFNYDADTHNGGRVENVTGSWTFQMTR